MQGTTSIWVVAAAGLLIACADGSVPSEGDLGAVDEPPTQTWEGAASVPEPGEHTLEITLQEVETEPGEETIFCHYLEPTTEDIWLTRFQSYQGSGGHHLILFRTFTPEPAGMIKDCRDGKSMSNMMLVVAPIEARQGQAGIVQFPEGMALRIPAGTQLVAQNHYINAGEETVTHADVMHLHQPSPDALDDTTVLHTFGSGSIDFEVPPGGVEYTDVFDCAFPVDAHVISATPHMHEQGLKFVAQMGPVDGPASVITVPEWKPLMRDVPPVTNFMDGSAPIAGDVRAGDVVRTFCTWQSQAEAPLRFPEEMCATFGYFYSEDPSAESFTCAGVDKVDPEMMPL